MNKERRTQLVVAALLCDSGMQRIPITIRTKKGKLEANEMSLVRRHTTLSSEMIMQKG